MSRKGQQASAGQGAGMVHAAGAVGEAGLCLEPSVGNGKGYGLHLSSRRAVGESCWEVKWEIASKSWEGCQATT